MEVTFSWQPCCTGSIHRDGHSSPEGWAKPWQEEHKHVLVPVPVVPPASTDIMACTAVLTPVSLWEYFCCAFLLSPTASHQVMPKKHGKCVCMPSHVTIISLRNSGSPKSFNHSPRQHKVHYHALSDFFRDYFFPFGWWCNWSYFPTAILAATDLEAWCAFEES